jgi:hypothetical protein
MIKTFFLPEAPALQYVIHNAGDINAKIYLKDEEKYLPWESGVDAHRFWEEVRRAKGALAPQPPKAIFHFVPEFKNQGDFVATLSEAVRRSFPGIEKDVMKLCLEGPT